VVEGVNGGTLAIIPSRGRPQQMLALADQIEHTTRGRVQAVLCVDDDDPTLPDYQRAFSGALRPSRVALHVGARRSLSEWTNWGASVGARHSTSLTGLGRRGPDWLVSMGDDHWPVTEDWDLLMAEAIRDTLDGPGWAYGDDKVKGAMLPTAWMQSAALADTLGWMMLPSCEHMYVDNVVLELGRAARRIAYVPYVHIEHRHPEAARVLGTTVAGAWDDTYRDSNRPEVFDRDRAAFETWRRESLASDVAKVRSLAHTTA
jgi:hypothetical protein